MDEIITPSQAAELLKIHVTTVYRLAQGGVITGKKERLQLALHQKP